MFPMRVIRVPSGRIVSWTLRFGFLAFVLIGLYPPWMVRIDVPYRMHVGQNAGYHLIVSPPAPDRNQPFGDRASVQLDWSRLMLEWVILAGVVGGVLAWQFTRTQILCGQPNDALQSDKEEPRAFTEDKRNIRASRNS